MFPVNNLNANLQATIAAGTADTALPSVIPHHPITCLGKLEFNEDNSFGCEHVIVPPDDPRTQMALKQTIATLIIELASEK